MILTTVINQKGGTGKTTTAVNLAYYLSAIKNSKVVLIDGDPQHSIDAMYRLRGGKNFDFYPFSFDQDYDQKDMAKNTRQLLQHKRYDHMIIDAGPATSDINDFFIQVSEISIVPILCDAFSLVGFLKLRLKIKSLNPEMRTYAFLNQYQRRYTLHAEMRSVMLDFPEYKDFPVRSTIKIAQASANGKPILQEYPNHPASKDYELLFNEIYK